MNQSSFRVALPFLFTVCALSLTAQPAGALDRFEIQVYEPDMNRPGQFGLEVHANYALQGRSTPEYDGELAPNHVARLTLEPAVGILPWLELGGYLQTLMRPDGGVRFAGAKLRAKMVPVRKPGATFFYGLNVEVGRVPSFVEPEGWANEFRPILGFDDGHWLIDVNPIFGYALTGPEAFHPDFEPCGKLGWNTQHGFMVGAEYYAGLGAFGAGFSPWREQEHMVYAVFDRASPAGSDDEGGWELNAGLGHSLTPESANTWSAKVIVGKSF